MKCSACGKENVDGARFCSACGAQLPDVVKEEPETTQASPAPATQVVPDASGPVSASSETSSSEAACDHLGPYELRGELGQGAMARVWRAYDPNLGREVAIKEPKFDQQLPPDVLDEMGRRFVREAKTAARLNHPGIVTIYAADVYEGNRPAIVMELVEGATLGDILERGKLDPASALDALDQLLDAIGYAHGQGVVHRDIKPDNIFVSSDGRVKLADFGIAHVDDDRATRATQMGTVLGTPGYMSPEQARGGVIDARSDLFSIGVVGYEMLAGRNPFGAGEGGDSTTLLYRIVHEPAPELPEAASAGLPADLRPGIMAALAKDPAQRPQTAAVFKSMLHGGAAPATPVPPAGGTGLADAAAAGKSGSLPKWLPYVIVAAVCAAVLAFVLFGALNGGGSGGRSAPPAQQGAAPASSASTQAGSSSSSVSSEAALAYLAVSDGKIAIYSNSSAQPYEVTDVATADLSSEDQAKLDKHIPCASIEDAQKKVAEYRDAIEKAKKEAEEKAKKDEEERQKREEEEKAKNTRYVCANDFVTLRSSPSTNASAIVRISVREPVEYVGDAGGGWVQVRYNGSTGYVIGKFISSDPNAPLVYDDV